MIETLQIFITLKNCSHLGRWCSSRTFTRCALTL